VLFVLKECAHINPFIISKRDAKLFQSQIVYSSNQVGEDRISSGYKYEKGCHFLCNKIPLLSNGFGTQIQRSDFFELRVSRFSLIPGVRETGAIGIFGLLPPVSIFGNGILNCGKWPAPFYKDKT